jgi:beta-mannanase
VRLKRFFRAHTLPSLVVLFAVVGLARAPRPQPAAAANPASSTVTQLTYLPLVTGTSSTTRLYWGALVDGLPPTSLAMQANGPFAAFEARAGKKMSILHWGQPWRLNDNDQPFQTSYFNNVRSHGAIPMLDWGSWVSSDGTEQPAYRLSQITGGAYDSYIQQWAAAAKAWGHPFFLRFDWEMNGTWQFPWSEQLNGNQPGDYVKAWRHVHDLFNAAGATNVTWVWCPNIASSVTRPYAALYPGDAYVDWTCFDGYNNYDTWLGFNTVFTGSGINWLYNSYQQLQAVAPSKPIMIGETASLEARDGGARKAAWISDAFTTQLSTHLPQVRAVVWFNWNSNNPIYDSLPIESSAASSAAFAGAIASSRYTANDFADLNTSPIPPP